MRRSLARLASAAASHPGGPPPRSAATAPALLPPIPLFRRLLRAHRRHLPPDMRILGDEYIKAEFRAHRTVDNPAHLIGFLSEWQLYAQKIEGDAWVGDKIEQEKLDKMSGEQIHQLHDLMRAIQTHHKGGASD